MRTIRYNFIFCRFWVFMTTMILQLDEVKNKLWLGCAKLSSSLGLLSHTVSYAIHLLYSVRPAELKLQVLLLSLVGRVDG